MVASRSSDTRRNTNAEETCITIPYDKRLFTTLNGAYQMELLMTAAALIISYIYDNHLSFSTCEDRYKHTEINICIQEMFASLKHSRLNTLSHIHRIILSELYIYL